MDNRPSDRHGNPTRASYLNRWASILVSWVGRRSPPGSGAGGIKMCVEATMRRLLTSGGCVAILAVLATLTLSSQGSGQNNNAATAPPLVITAFNGGPEPAGWTSPKTPWGEPDLQGVWSSDDASFPVSRTGGRGGPPPTG